MTESRIHQGEGEAPAEPQPAATHPLHPAYLATHYCVDGPQGRFVLHVGERHGEVDALLERHHVSTWAYLTAHNPGSVLTHPEQNAVQQQRLAAEVARHNWPCFPGAGSDPAGDWPAEASLLILGLALDTAHDLARHFGQLAFLFGARGEPARLIWTAGYNTGCLASLDNHGNLEKG